MSYKLNQLKHTAAILNKQSVLRDIVQRANSFAVLQRIVHSYLPGAAAEHCQLANYNQGRLVLVIDNAHWATRLRYQQNQLMDKLCQHNEFSDLQRIQFKVRPNTAFNDAIHEQKPRLEISAQAGLAIFNCAEAIEDPHLRAALERLARNAAKE